MITNYRSLLVEYNPASPTSNGQPGKMAAAQSYSIILFTMIGVVHPIIKF